MQNFVKLLFISTILIILIVLAGCSPSSSDSKDFYLNVTVKGTYNGKPVEGTSVIYQRIVVSQSSHTRGEAVRVDLGNGNSVYLSLLDRNLKRFYIQAIFKTFGPYTHGMKARDLPENTEALVAETPMGTQKKFEYTQWKFKGSPHKGYPLLLAFKDKNDPSSVFMVDTERPVQIFGGTFKFEGIYLERIARPKVVSFTLEEGLPWVNPNHQHWDDYRAKGHVGEALEAQPHGLLLRDATLGQKLQRKYLSNLKEY